jgi:preprotein translocase subunit SecG
LTMILGIIFFCLCLFLSFWQKRLFYKSFLIYNVRYREVVWWRIKF